jgi:poly-gamma-glutamate capsule biosynthesis protein CapA/YwtB (metallophosphatase superfamily)
MNLKSFFILILLTISCRPVISQANDSSRLSLIFAGDIMGHDEQISGAWDPTINRYNYETTFRYIKSYIEEADIAIANLEVTLAGPPYKGYPQFSSPDELATAAHDAGFDVFVQANNHALDRGPAGFVRTLATLDSLNIIHTGTYIDSMSRISYHPLILEKNNIRLALLNYTYETNGLEINKPFIVNRIDTAQIRQDLEKARLATPDFIIVMMHWGEEYARFENNQQQKLASFILRHGADVIIGSHPHVVQPVKLYYNDDSTNYRIVVYSLGNFVSNQRAQYKDGGIVFELDLLKTCDSTRVEDFSYLPFWVYREDLPGKSTFYILPINFFELNSTFFNLKDFDLYKLTRFAEDTREHMKNLRENLFWSNKGQRTTARPLSLFPCP